MGPPKREAKLRMYFNRGLIDEESWLDVLLQFGVAEKISAQKSSITNKDNGEVYEFKNTKFLDWIRAAANNEAHKYCKQKVRDVLVIEQDPDKREEELVLEEIAPGEET